MRYRIPLLAAFALIGAQAALGDAAWADPKERGGQGQQLDDRRGGRIPNRDFQKHDFPNRDRLPWGEPELGSRWSPDEARDAVRQGRHRPLRDVLRGVQNQLGGEMVDVTGLEERGGGRAVYKLRWRTPDGRLLDLRVDAESGQIIR